MKKLILIASAVALTACSSMTELKTESLSKKTVPTWYLDHIDTGSEKSAWYKPWDQQGMYYAVAEDVSPSMEFAMKKATLKAKAKIADRVNGEMNNRSTIKIDEYGMVDAPIARAQAQDIIVNLIGESVVRTYGVEKKMIIYNPEARNYRAFVMLKISQKDVAAIAATYDQNKQVKLNSRVGGQSLEETTKEVLEQAQR
jgi:hypothetical protein